MRAFTDSALEAYWKATVEVVDKYAATWVAKGKVQMDKELDDMAMEITARCLLGATDQGHIHKLRTIMGGCRWGTPPKPLSPTLTPAPMRCSHPHTDCLAASSTPALTRPSRRRCGTLSWR